MPQVGYATHGQGYRLLTSKGNIIGAPQRAPTRQLQGFTMQTENCYQHGSLIKVQYSFLPNGAMAILFVY
jgi:hypothetical protein